MQLTNGYLRLGPRFCSRERPVPVRAPELFLWNQTLADELGLGLDGERDRERIAAWLGGNETLFESEPVALVYAGHQFGSFVPRLGDGRAHVLGDCVDRGGTRRDLQLKGSGPTLFARGGDGRCALGPAIREMLMSEAMHALGVPTTRSLAVVLTGETVYRQEPLTGAVVTRVASSHLRVGSFEYFAARGEIEMLRQLADFAITRHDPDLAGDDPRRFIGLLERVIERQIALVVDWLRVGFIHGVMNTDNTALSGQTIDFGPCAMLGAYDPTAVYSSIDHFGRYAFGNQPKIALWNMARFAECLLPLIDDDPRRALSSVEALFTSAAERFETAWLEMLARKSGLVQRREEDEALLRDLLRTMAEKRLDYTITFDLLTRSRTSEDVARELDDLLGDWIQRWRERLRCAAVPPGAERDGAGPTGTGGARVPTDALHDEMRRQNPRVIPRNHHVEATIAACVATRSPDAAARFLDVLRRPYDELPTTAEYQDPPADGDRDYRTFCGT